jgi:hypothetical protein
MTQRQRKDNGGFGPLFASICNLFRVPVLQDFDLQVDQETL